MNIMIADLTLSLSPPLTPVLSLCWNTPLNRGVLSNFASGEIAPPERTDHVQEDGKKKHKLHTDQSAPPAIQTATIQCIHYTAYICSYNYILCSIYSLYEVSTYQ